MSLRGTLEHLDQVERAGPAGDAGLEEAKTSLVGQVLFYAAMALIPIVIFGLLLLVAKHT